jgi:radical SAM superfamily enzyme YgiQ (UPF0313 family)
MDDRLEPPLGLLYIGAVLRKRGNPVSLVDLSGKYQQDYNDAIPDGYDVYGFSTYTLTYANTLRLVSQVRLRNPGAVLLAGGPHATALPESVSNDGFDVVVTGEGEIAVCEIMERLETESALPRILAGKPPEPLDELPFPAYDLADFSSYHRQVAGKRSASVLSSRGCPFRCVFCNSNIMGQGKRIRYRSGENVVAEIRWIKLQYGISHFRFQDDVFTINRKRLSKLAPKLADENIIYRCFARVNGFSEQLAHLLYESGCRHVSFGIESGSPSILGRYGMDKSQTPAQIRLALEHAVAAGLIVRVFLMVGFPGETDDTIAETLSLMKECPPEFDVIILPHASLTRLTKLLRSPIPHDDLIRPVIAALTTSGIRVQPKNRGDRPLCCMTDRVTVLRAYRVRPFVFLFDGPDSLSLIERLKPDFFIKEERDPMRSIVQKEARLVERLGDQVIWYTGQSRLTSSRLAARIRNSLVQV